MKYKQYALLNVTLGGRKEVSELPILDTHIDLW